MSSICVNSLSSPLLTDGLDRLVLLRLCLVFRHQLVLHFHTEVSVVHVHGFLVPIVLHRRQDHLLWFLAGSCSIERDLLSLFTFHRHRVVVNVEDLVYHGLVSPLGQQWCDGIISSIDDEQEGLL